MKGYVSGMLRALVGLSMSLSIGSRSMRGHSGYGRTSEDNGRFPGPLADPLLCYHRLILLIKLSPHAMLIVALRRQ